MANAEVPPETRAEALWLWDHTEVTPTPIADALGINASNMYRWRKTAEQGKLTLPEVSVERQHELLQLMGLPTPDEPRLPAVVERTAELMSREVAHELIEARVQTANTASELHRANQRIAELEVELDRLAKEHHEDVLAIQAGADLRLDKYQEESDNCLRFLAQRLFPG